MIIRDHKYDFMNTILDQGKAISIFFNSSSAMSTLTPEQITDLPKQITTLLDGGVVIPRELFEKLQRAVRVFREETAASLHEESESYAKLDGSGWSLVPDFHTFPDNVQKIVEERDKSDTNESEARHGIDRMLHLMQRSYPVGDQFHSLDLSCLDISEAGTYMDHILWQFRFEHDWASYKQWYDHGILFIARLAAIKAKDPSIALDAAIYGLESIYKAYNDITKA